MYSLSNKVQKNIIICNMKNVFIITCVLNKRFNFYIYWLHAFEPGIFIVYIVYVLWKKKQKKNTFWTSGLFLSADLPERESSRDEVVCLRGGDVGVYIPARLTWMWRVGVTALVLTP